jgi:hypothetical protein
MSAIFISYRREDAEDSARALYETLLREFGSRERLFMDVEDIQFGLDFRTAVENKLDDCGVFLAVIGPAWLDVKDPNDASGRRRLDNPGDFVRQELATALKRKALPVIPVLVRGAGMPSPDKLPDDLRDVAFRNALTLSHAVGWEDSVKKLVQQIRPLVGGSDGEQATGTAVSAIGTAPRTARQIAPAPAAADSPAPDAGLSKVMLYGIPALIAAAILGYFAIKPGPKPSTAAPYAQPANSSTTPPAQSQAPSGLVVTIERNKRLANSPGPMNVLIDGEQQGQMSFDSGGNAPLQIHASEGEHRFTFINPETKASCSGTFTVSPGSRTFIPRMNKVPVCSLEPVTKGD